MAERNSGRIWRALPRFLRRAFAIDPGPADLAESVADRLLDPLTPDKRLLLRQRFGVDAETNIALEEIATGYSGTRSRLRQIEAAALIRLYRWEIRQACLPDLQQRLARRIAEAHHELLELLCDAPPIRPVLVGWHDGLVAGRLAASEIAGRPGPVVPTEPDGDAHSAEIGVAKLLRNALWVHVRAARPAREPGQTMSVRNDERDRALIALRDVGFNARAMRKLAESLLGHARRIFRDCGEAVPELVDTSGDLESPAPSAIGSETTTPWPESVTEPGVIKTQSAEKAAAEAGMPLDELWRKGDRVDATLRRAERNLRLLVESGMPLLAETAVEEGLRGGAFVDRIEQGRTGLWQSADGFCFTGAADCIPVPKAILGKPSD